ALAARIPTGRRSTAARGSDSTLALLGRVARDLLYAVLGLAALMTLMAARRTLLRSKRTYALYELHLSTHDQAKGQDLEDMVEQVANIMRAWPADRARYGQPYFALELICGSAQAANGQTEMEWSVNIRCQPEAAVALDGAISAAYPDVRL